ncbi:MAG: hypothetical protein ACO37Y_12965, partial [Steroidobacteraceae bacterium]
GNGNIAVASVFTDSSSQWIYLTEIDPTSGEIVHPPLQVASGEVGGFASRIRLSIAAQETTLIIAFQDLRNMKIDVLKLQRSGA